MDSKRAYPLLTWILVLDFSMYMILVLDRITGVHSNQDQILLVKIREYLGFYIDRRS